MRKLHLAFQKPFLGVFARLGFSNSSPTRTKLVFMETLFFQFVTRQAYLLPFAMLFSMNAFAAYSNFNSVVIGQQAAGLGGAFTALHGDAGAVAFYNPASMTRMDGISLSASTSAFQKIDTNFEENISILDVTREVNQGFFEPVPTSAGTVASFGHFSIGFSILVPDFNTFSGNIEADGQNSSFLSFTDQSIWVGPSFALNLTENTAFGLSFFYTARKFNRTVSDQVVDGNSSSTIIQEKALTNNSLVYLFGLYHQLTENISLGTSLRFPSTEVSGSGSFFQSESQSNPANVQTVSQIDVDSDTFIPPRLGLGFAYTIPGQWTFSFDFHLYGPENYSDLNISGDASDQIKHVATTNVLLGLEYVFNPSLLGRIGYFTNQPSHPEISSVPTQRTGDHISMSGVSLNLELKTSNNTTFTFGGYWTGGDGDTVQLSGGALKKLPISQHIFAMVVGTGYHF